MSHDIAQQLRALLAQVEHGDAARSIYHQRDLLNGGQLFRVDDVTGQYRRDFLQPHYKQKSPGHYYRLTRVCDWIDDEFCDVPVTSFGPKKLLHLRQQFIKAGGCRWYVNLQAQDVIRVFRHGVAHELVPPEILVGLQAVRPLQPGEHHDNPRRAQVTLRQVQATLPHLVPVVADMVRLQLRTGCRPSELFAITPGAVDRSRPDVYWIRPADHKTARHGIRKAIPLVDDARDIIQRYLLRPADQHCFLNRRGRPYNRNSYRQAVLKAAKAAGVAKWTPYALRSLAARTVRQQRGLEAARALLGHQSAEITEQHYAALTEREAVEAARVTPKVGNATASG